MRRYALVVGLLVACSGDDGAAQAPSAQEQAPTTPAEAPPKAPDARALAISGRHAEAAALAETEGLADLAARERALSGALEAVADPALRAELALRQGLLPAAVAAAQAAGGADGAALLAQAALAGASVQAPADPASAALLAWATAPSAEKAARYAEAAAALSGWRVSLLRAEVLAGRGDLEGALAQAAEALSAAPLQANLLRAELVMRADSGAHAAEAAGWARAAADEAVKAADAGALREALSAMMALYGLQGQVDQGLVIAQEVHEAVIAEHGPGGAGASGMALAQAAQSAGRPIAVQEAAAAARAALSGEAAAEAAWLEGWAAHQLGDAESVKAAAAAVEGPRSQALAALARMVEGLPPSPEHPLPREGLTSRERVYLLLEAATLDPAHALEQLSEAVRAADRTGDVSLRVQTRLALESAERARGLASARQTRAALASLLGTRTPSGLSNELAARALLDGEAGATLAGEGAFLQAWAALSAGQAPATPVEGWGAGISAWATGRALLATDPAKAEAAFAEALGALPLHRQGPLSLGTVLDGSQGVGEARDLAALAALGGTDGLGAALSCHEIRHRLRAMGDDVALGRDPTAGLPAEVRRELRAAVVRARVEVLMYLLGGELPTDMLAAVAEAEKQAAASSAGLKNSLPAPGRTLASLREGGSVSYLSYIALGGQLQVLAITPEGGELRELGRYADVVGMVRDYRDSLARAARDGGKADALLGDRLRQTLLDPLKETLLRYGRYQIIAPAELLSVSVLALPESPSGLRFLADIRTISQAPSFRHLQAERPTIEKFSPDFLGLAEKDDSADILAAAMAAEAAAAAAAAEAEGDGAEAPEKAEGAAEAGEGGAQPVALTTEEAPPAPKAPAPPKDQTPRDMTLAARHFGAGLRTLAIGEEATQAAYTGGAGQARSIYLANLKPSADGGFVLADGEMSLSELQAQAIVADLVFISAAAEPAMQAHRARALLEAGAKTVIVLSWEIPPTYLERYVDGLYESLNRDRPVVLALEDARQTLVREALLLNPDSPVGDPAVWGAPVVYGAL